MKSLPLTIRVLSLSGNSDDGTLGGVSILQSAAQQTCKCAATVPPEMAALPYRT